MKCSPIFKLITALILFSTTLVFAQTAKTEVINATGKTITLAYTKSIMKTLQNGETYFVPDSWGRYKDKIYFQVFVGNAYGGTELCVQDKHSSKRIADEVYTVTSVNLANPTAPCQGGTIPPIVQNPTFHNIPAEVSLSPGDSYSLNGYAIDQT